TCARPRPTCARPRRTCAGPLQLAPDRSALALTPLTLLRHTPAHEYAVPLCGELVGAAVVMRGAETGQVARSGAIGRVPAGETVARGGKERDTVGKETAGRTEKPPKLARPAHVVSPFR